MTKSTRFVKQSPSKSKSIHSNVRSIPSALFIARPFEGEYPYKRTSRRHDYSLVPPKKTMLNYLSEQGREVLAVGKINDIFAGSGITKSVRTANNAEGIERTLEWMDFQTHESALPENHPETSEAALKIQFLQFPSVRWLYPFRGTTICSINFFLRKGYIYGKTSFFDCFGQRGNW